MENDRIWYARKTMLDSGRPHFDWSGINHKHYTMISASSGHQIKISVLRRTSSPKWKFINQYQSAPGFNSLGMRNKTNDKKMSACYHFMTPKTQHNTSVCRLYRQPAAIPAKLQCTGPMVELKYFSYSNQLVI